ncbi:cytochrome P450 [Archangium violaceum]|uniref:Cytochrome P450 n=1 Tax=Archangium violaceum Cb vi76 TaxID=1406225 RepID=A0A084T181_9BACT|nr:cytochrome P450 [Archangium violaceum]KFA94466.1 hypothetical protein Q664_02820 [Archangium violaceum Cb vi76]
MIATPPGTHAVELPGPRTTPLLGVTGNYIRFIADQVHWLEKLSSYGPLVALSRDSIQHVFIFHPDYNMQVLSNPALFRSLELWRTGPEDSSLRRLWTGLVSINGEMHRQHRRMMMPSFHRKKVESYRDAMVACIDRMLSGWKPGEVRDVFLEMRQVTLLIVTQVLFGLEDDRETLRMGLLMAEWLKRYTSPAVHLVPWNKPGLPFRRLLEVSERGEAAIRGLIARKRAQGADGDDVLSMLLHARDEEGGSMSDAELVGQTNILFVAGHETTTNSLTWTLFLLDQHPEVHAALLEELEGELKGAPPTIEQLERLPLLDRVVKESLRILPPVTTAFRTSTAPFEMGGLHFEAETHLYYSPYITHRLPDLYPEPKRFLPERWLKAEPPVYGYIPFSNGPRRCIGATLALLEIKLMLSMLLPRFRLSLPPGARVDPMVRATLHPNGGLPMRVHARDERVERPEVRGRIRDLVALS